MALLTTQERLEQVQAAIQRSELMISYNMGDRQHVRERLSTLYKQEKYLYDLINQESGTKAKILGVSFNGIA